MAMQAAVLKKIAVNQVRLGMHLHAMEGPWINHPFWKTRFVIDSAQELKRLQDSAVDECWIDNQLGVDVAEVANEAASSAAASAPPLPPDAPAAARPPALTPQRGFDEELTQAAAICDRGRSAVEALFAEARMGRTIDSQGCLPLVEEITSSVQRNPGAMVSLARLKTKDDYTYMHSVAVCALMIALARQLELDEGQCRLAGLAGLMHDVGKAVMPLDVLNKPGKLTDAEFDVMRTHPERGHALLSDGVGVAPETLDVALHHHEKFDGSGYPHRLAGEQISLFARMGAVCDVYDAITSNRPYKSGWDPAESIAKMASWKGHFDSAVFNAFVRSLGIYPTGSLVRLASGKLAVVVSQNADALVSPRVKAFFSTRSQMHIAPQLLDLARKDCADRIVARQSAADGHFAHLDELWADPQTLSRLRR